MRLALMVGRMVRWLRRDDRTLDAREAGSGLVLEASEMVSGDLCCANQLTTDVPLSPDGLILRSL